MSGSRRNTRRNRREPLRRRTPPSRWEHGPPARRVPEPPKVPESLPWSVVCVLPRGNPAEAAVAIALARIRLHELAALLARRQIYLEEGRLEDARLRVKECSRELRRLSRRFYRGPCARLRGRARFSGYISVAHRDALDDGGLSAAAAALGSIERVLRGLRSAEPFYVRVRDADMSATTAKMAAVAEPLCRVLDAIAVDVSDGDLSGLRAAEVDVLGGALWTERTEWPPGAIEGVRRRSRQVCTGVFQVSPAVGDGAGEGRRS